MNEDETEDISEEEKVNEIDPGEIDTSLTTTVIKVLIFFILKKIILMTSTYILFLTYI